MIINYDNIIVMGDLNFDILNDKKCQALKDLCDVLDFWQLVLKPTCFMKNGIPLLVDVVLTNQKNKCFNIQNCPTGISDCHNIISVTIKGDVPVQKRQIITYKSYKMLILIALIVILRKFHSQILRIYQHLVKYTMYIMKSK